MYPTKLVRTCMACKLRARTWVYQYHLAQVTSLWNISFTQKDNSTGGIQTPSASSPGHLNVFTCIQTCNKSKSKTLQCINYPHQCEGPSSLCHRVSWLSRIQLSLLACSLPSQMFQWQTVANFCKHQEYILKRAHMQGSSKSTIFTFTNPL